MSLDSNTPVLSKTKEPVYQAIADKLRLRITSGKWRPGQRISSESELSHEFGVCRTTVSKTLKILEIEGILKSQRGKGWFASDIAKMSKTQVIGVVLFDLEDLTHPVMSARIAGIQKVVNEAGYHLNIIAINKNGRNPGSGKNMVEKSAVDGVIVSAQQFALEQVEKLASRVPVVWAEHKTIRPGWVGVCLDFVGGGFSAMRYLADSGHKDVVFIAADKNYSIVQEQIAGIKLYVNQMSSDIKLRILHGESFSQDTGSKIINQLLAKNELPSAVICGSDDIVIGAYNELIAAGKSIPEDVSLISWNDSEQLKSIPMGITAIRADHYKAGYVSAQKLISMLKNGIDDDNETVTIPSELIIRDSTKRI